MSDPYLWVKALHVVAIIAWMAGLLYLPRLFAYHAGVAAGSEAARLFEVMERRLLRIIMTPALIVALASGLYLAASHLSSPWLHAKLLLVVGLCAMHGFMARWRKQFVAGTQTRSSKFFRAVNEGPTLLMIGIVVLVIVKPF